MVGERKGSTYVLQLPLLEFIKQLINFSLFVYDYRFFVKNNVEIIMGDEGKLSTQKERKNSEILTITGVIRSLIKTTAKTNMKFIEHINRVDWVGKLGLGLGKYWAIGLYRNMYRGRLKGCAMDNKVDNVIKISYNKEEWLFSVDSVRFRPGTGSEREGGQW